jgi:hypothetical protein
MIPLIIRGANVLFVAPENGPEVGKIYARQSVENGTPITAVAWEPSTEEIARLFSGAPIVVEFIGYGLAAHRVTVGAPADDEKKKEH